MYGKWLEIKGNDLAKEDEESMIDDFLLEFVLFLILNHLLDVIVYYFSLGFDGEINCL